MTGFALTHVTITPNDSTALDTTYEAIVIVDGGDVAIEDADGTQITYDAVPAMSVFQNFRPSKILATGTTATKIVGWK